MGAEWTAVSLQEEESLDRGAWMRGDVCGFSDIARECTVRPHLLLPVQGLGRGSKGSGRIDRGSRGEAKGVALHLPPWRTALTRVWRCAFSHGSPDVEEVAGVERPPPAFGTNAPVSRS